MELSSGVRAKIKKRRLRSFWFTSGQSTLFECKDWR